MRIKIVRIKNPVEGSYCVEIVDTGGAALASVLVPRDELFPATPPQGGAINAASAKSRLLTAGSHDAVREIGNYLFKILDRDAVGAALRALVERDPLADQQERCLILLDIEPQELEALPWEALYCDRRLSQDSEIVFARGRVKLDHKDPPRRWPLKVLAVVGFRPEETTGWEEEVDALRHVFRELRHCGDLEVLEQPSRSELLDAYRAFRPDVLHFIGHGGASLVCSSGAASWSWQPDDITSDFLNIEREHGVSPPRLAFLNACRTADAAAKGEAWSVQRAFLKAGARAVISMQGDIRGTAAARFAKEFYRALVGAGTGAPAKRAPIHEAVARARKAVTEVEDAAPSAWVLPTLSLAVPPESVLPVTFELPERFLKDAPVTPEFVSISRFVDRTAERRAMCLCLDNEEHALPSPPSTSHAGGRHPSVLVIRGDPGVGKSALVQWTLEHCACRDYRHTYLDLRHLASRDFVGLLRLLRDGSRDRDPKSGLRRGFSEEAAAFGHFNAALNRLLDKKPLGGAALAPEADKNLAFVPDRLGSDNAIEELFSYFREALKGAIAAARPSVPVLIVLDQLAGLVRDPTAAYLCNHLFAPIADGSVEGARLIVVVTKEEYDALALASMIPAPEIVDLGRFKHKEARMIAKEYGAFKPGSKPEKQFIALLDDLKRDFSPGELKTIHEAVSLLPQE